MGTGENGMAVSAGPEVSTTGSQEDKMDEKRDGKAQLACVGRMVWLLLWPPSKQFR